MLICCLTFLSAEVRRKTAHQIVAPGLHQAELSSKHRQHKIDKEFERYIAKKKLSTEPEDIAIALQGEALIRSYSLSSASRPVTPSLSPNLTRINTFETSLSSPPSTPQRVATKPSLPLKKSQIPEVARPVKRYQRAHSTLFDAAPSDSDTTLKVDHDANTFKNTIWESFQADKEGLKPQRTPNTPHYGKVIEESNPKYPWPPKMAGGAGRYRHAEEASASWIQEHAIAQVENTCMAGALWNLATRINKSSPNGSSFAKAAGLKLLRAEDTSPKEVTHKIDENGVHIFKGFNSSVNLQEPIPRTESDAPIQIAQSVHGFPVKTNKDSFGHGDKLVDLFGGHAQASHKAPSSCGSAHPLSQSIRAATKTQTASAPRQQMEMTYSDDENAIASDSEDEEESDVHATNINPTTTTTIGHGNGGPTETTTTATQLLFTKAKKVVPRPNLVGGVSLIHEQLQMRRLNDKTAVESYTGSGSFEKPFEVAMKTAEVSAQTSKEKVKTSVRAMVAVKSQAKTATSGKLAPKAKAIQRRPSKKAVRFSKQLVTKVDNRVNIIAAQDLVDRTGSVSTTGSSNQSDSSVEIQSQAPQIRAGNQQRKDSTDRSSVSSGEKLPQQKKVSTKAKGTRRAIEGDGNDSDGSAATVVPKSTKIGRQRAVTAIRMPKVEVAGGKIEVYPQPA